MKLKIQARIASSRTRRRQVQVAHEVRVTLSHPLYGGLWGRYVVGARPDGSPDGDAAMARATVDYPDWRAISWQTR